VAFGVCAGLFHLGCSKWLRLGNRPSSGGRSRWWTSRRSDGNPPAAVART
jgi:hypothetical protein